GRGCRSLNAGLEGPSQPYPRYPADNGPVKRRSAGGAASRRRSIEDLERDLDHAGVVVSTGAAAADLVESGIARERVTVGAPGRQRVVGVGDDDDPGAQRDRVAPQTFGVARAVQELVARPDDRQHALALVAHRAQQTLAGQ